MNTIEIRTKLLLSIQRAMLGMIYPSIRAIVVDFIELQELIIIIYLDREPIEFDFENLSDMSGEVLSDMEFLKVEELCIYSKEPFSNLNDKGIWVYMRKED